jgi:hypothetical protein
LQDHIAAASRKITEIMRRDQAASTEKEADRV